MAYAPAYLRVSEAIRDRILRRDLKEGQALPTEAELARQFEVNRSTVREALRKLESSGLLGRRAGGKRLYVTRPTREAPPPAPVFLPAARSARRTASRPGSPGCRMPARPGAARCPP